MEYSTPMQIVFKNPPTKRDISLEQALPFVHTEQIHNPTAHIDNGLLWIKYQITPEFHREICETVDILYGVKENNMITIAFFQHDHWFLEHIQKKLNLCDVPNDVLEIIGKKIGWFNEKQLSETCKLLRCKMYHFGQGNYKIQRSIGSVLARCIRISGIDQQTDKIGLYSGKVINDGECLDNSKLGKNVIGLGDVRYIYNSKTEFTILGKTYDLDGVIDNLKTLNTLGCLSQLVVLDKKLNDHRYYFLNTKKMQIITNNNDNGIGKGNLTHLRRTNQCFKRFNEKLKSIFGERWFNVARDMISGKVDLIDLDNFEEELRDARDFGEQILENYEEVKQTFSKSKREYHNGPLIDDKCAWFYR